MAGCRKRWPAICVLGHILRRVTSAGSLVARYRCLVRARTPRVAAWPCAFWKKEPIMPLSWSKDVDNSLAVAKERGRPILLDFSAAPA